MLVKPQKTGFLSFSGKKKPYSQKTVVILKFAI